MSSERTHTAVVAAAGTAYLVAGTALLLQELGVVAVSWSFVLPLVLVLTGLALLATAGAGRDRKGVEQATRPAGGVPGGRPPM